MGIAILSGRWAILEKNEVGEHDCVSNGLLRTACLPSLRPIVVCVLRRSMNSASKHSSRSNGDFGNYGSYSAWTAVRSRRLVEGGTDRHSVDNDYQNLVARSLDRGGSGLAPTYNISEPTDRDVELQDLGHSEGIRVQRDIKVSR